MLRFRELVGRFLLVLGSSACAVMLAEAVLRLLPGPWSPTYGMFVRRGSSLEPVVVWQADARVGWRLLPSQRFLNRSIEFSAEITTNSLGFRGPREWARASGPVVAVLGDSMVEALQVDDAETFTARLQPALGAPTGHDGQVWNVGTSSFGPPHYLKTFRTFLADRHPEIVLVVLFAANDIEDSSPRLKSIPTLRPRYAWRNGEPEDVLDFDAPPAPEPGPWTSAKAWLRQSSHLYRRMIWARYAVRRDGSPAGGAQAPPATSPELEEAWRLALWSTARLYSEATNAGATVRIVLMPARSDVVPELRAASRLPRLRDSLLERGIPFLDLSEVFARGYEQRLQVHFPSDGHLTEEGHRLTARALEGPIAELLAGRAPR
jgi:hypothetical protein